MRLTTKSTKSSPFLLLCVFIGTNKTKGTQMFSFRQIKVMSFFPLFLFLFSQNDLKQHKKYLIGWTWTSPQVPKLNEQKSDMPEGMNTNYLIQIPIKNNRRWQNKSHQNLSIPRTWKLYKKNPIKTTENPKNKTYQNFQINQNNFFFQASEDGKSITRSQISTRIMTIMHEMATIWLKLHDQSIPND